MKVAAILVAILASLLLTANAAAQVGDCVCEMQGRFRNGAFEMDYCENGDCTFGINEGTCVYESDVQADGTWYQWCNCSLSPGEWPTLCVCSGAVTTLPLPVLCWTVHGCAGIKQCSTDHWWPLPANWVPICQCN